MAAQRDITGTAPIHPFVHLANKEGPRALGPCVHSGPTVDVPTLMEETGVNRVRDTEQTRPDKCPEASAAPREPGIPAWKAHVGRGEQGREGTGQAGRWRSREQ